MSEVSAQDVPSPRLRPGPLPKPGPKPVKLTISVPHAFAQELRNAVFHLRNSGHPVTLTGLIVDSCTRRLAEIAAASERPIPDRSDQTLRPGPLGPQATRNVDDLDDQPRPAQSSQSRLA